MTTTEFGRLPFVPARTLRDHAVFESLRQQYARGGWVLCPQATLLLRLPKNVPQILRNALPEPVHAGLRMLPGSSHCKCHVYYPCVPPGRPLSA